ncbi:hypothetical protein ACROYT_G016567 [Oculina patagonica]
MAWVYVTSKKNAQKAKKCLEEKGYYGKERKVARYTEEEVAIPIKQGLAELLKNEITGGAEKSLLLSIEGRIEQGGEHAVNIRQHKVSPQEKLKLAIENLLQMKSVTFDGLLQKDIPHHWEQHGDLILLPENSFTLDKWKLFGEELWQVVAKSLGAARLAKKSTINNDGFRTPKVSLLLGDNGWVTHTDNGIKYTFDVTKCMFSSGNITEKIRVGNFDCNGQTVVDLYAGIGYFVLPYLVHSKAAIVYACEWNENAIQALKRNLQLNGVDKQCVIYEGDNQKFPLQGVADHVNLGLIPSSEAGWPVACAALRSDKGGWLHVHGNVTSGLTHSERTVSMLSSTETSFLTYVTKNPSTASFQSPLHCSEVAASCDHSPVENNEMPSCNKKMKAEWLDWGKYVSQTMLQHLKKSHDSQNWNVHIRHIEHVKSYAPHIDHVVLDVECRPVKLCKLN